MIIDRSAVSWAQFIGNFWWVGHERRPVSHAKPAEFPLKTKNAFGICKQTTSEPQAKHIFFCNFGEISGNNYVAWCVTKIKKNPPFSPPVDSLYFCCVNSEGEGCFLAVFWELLFYSAVAIFLGFFMAYAHFFIFCCCKHSWGSYQTLAQ